MKSNQLRSLLLTLSGAICSAQAFAAQSGLSADYLATDHGFYFLDSSGTKFVEMTAPGSVTTTYALTLPPAAPSVSGEVLSSDTGGVLSWASALTNPMSSPATFNGGIVFGGGGSNLNNYQAATKSTTFTFDGTSGGVSSSVTLAYSRVGNWVTLEVPGVLATSGTSGSSLVLKSNTAIDSWALPVSNVRMVVQVMKNGTIPVQAGLLVVDTTGKISIYADPSMSNGWTTNPNSGLDTAAVYTISYRAS